MNTVEKKFVHDSYQKIAKDFSQTRGYLWKSVKQFVTEIEKKSIVIEIGSGNGKNLYRDDCYNMAFDLCSEFTAITSDKGIESVIANGLHLPVRDNMSDYTLCIAMLHHLTEIDRRLQVLQEIVRITKPGGKLLIQVWAMEQPKESRRTFLVQDNMVPFQRSDKKYKIERFYHIFREGELDNLVGLLPNVHILQSFWEVGNYVLIIEKEN